MFAKYNFINIISLLLAGGISSVYFYVLGVPFTRYIVAASLVYFIFFILILFLTGNIEREKYSFLKNKLFQFGEIFILLLLIFFSLVFRGLDYWSAAGMFILGLIIVFDSRSVRENVTRFILLIISPVFYTGLILQHGFFTEVIFFISFLIMAESFTKKKTNYIITAAALGFISLFNPYLLILYTVFLFYFFRDNYIGGVMFAFISLLAYFAIRLYLGMTLSPAGISMETGYIIPALIVSVYVGFMVRSVREAVFLGGVLISVSVLIKFALFKYPEGILILSAIYPMFIISLEDYRSEKWLGKILDN